MPINDAVYEEVVRIVIDAKQALADVNSVGAQLSANLAKAMRQGELKVFKDAAELRKQVEIELQREIERHKINEAKETYRRKLGMSKEAAREEREIAKELHRYRLDGIKERERAEEIAIKRTARLFEEQEQRKLEFAKRFNKFRSEQSAISSAPSLMSRMGQTGNALRTGAAVAGATGNFQLAAGFYGLERVASQAGIAEASIFKLSAGFGILGAAAAVAGTALWTMFKGNDFNEALHDMGTLLSEVNNKDLSAFNARLEQLAFSAVKVSVAFNSNLIDVVKGFKTALSSGIEAEDLEKFSMIVGNVSTALGTSFDQTTNILTSFKDAYNLSINQMSLVGDQLFRLVDVGKVNVSELMSSFGRLIPVAANAGVTITDAFAGVATLSRSGMSTSQSVTALTQMISKIVNPSEKAKKAFQELGIQFGAAAFEGRTLSEVVAELKAKTEGQGDLIGRLFPEERAKRGAAGLRTILDLLQKNAAEIEGSAGAASKAAFARMDTFTVKMGQINKVFSGTVAIVGQNLLDVANKVFFGSGGFSANRLNELQITFEEIGQVITGIGSGLIAVGKIVAGFSAIAMHTIKAMWQANKFQFEDAFASASAAVDSATELGRGLGASFTGYADAIRNSKDRIEQLKIAVDETAAGDSTEALVDPFDKMALAAAGASGEIETLSDRQEKLFDERVQSKATKFEQQTLEMYQNQITKLEQVLDLKERIASAFATDTVNTQMPGASVKTKSAMRRSIVDNEMQSNGSSQVIDQLKDFAGKIAELKNKVDARAFTAEQVDAWDKFKGVLGKVWSELGEAAHKQAVGKVEDFNKKVLSKTEQIYKSDVDAYEKAQDEKLSYLKRVYKDMESAGKKNADMMADIQESLMANALGGEQDPDRRRRIAEQQMASAKAKLSNASTSEEAETAYNAYKEAAEARRSNTSDTKRGARNFEGDLTGAQELIQSIGEKEQRGGQNRLNRAQNQSLIRPDMKAAAAQAVQVANLELAVKAEGEYKIKFTADGKALDFITEAVMNKIEIEQKNQTGQPKFPKTKFGSSVR